MGPNQTSATAPSGARSFEHKHPDLRANVADRKLTIYIEHGTLAASVVAASDLISALATEPDFDGLDLWSVPVNEATAEGQF